MSREAWYTDVAWRFAAAADGSATVSVPHPARAGLSIDLDRPLDVRSAALGYAVFAYRDERAVSYRHGEYQVPERVFVLWRLPPAAYPIAAELRIEDGEWVYEQLVVARQPGGPGITQTTLKNVSLRRIAALVGPRATSRLRLKPGGGLERKIAVLSTAGSAEFVEAAGRLSAPKRGKRLDSRLLKDVAKCYRSAVAEQRRDPVWAVADKFQVARSTAGRYVRQCRERGLLGPTSPGRKGENGV